MFDGFTKILEIPVILHKEIRDENVLLLTYISSLFILDRNDIIYANTNNNNNINSINNISLMNIPSTVIKEQYFISNDIIVYKYLEENSPLLISDPINGLNASNLVFTTNAYRNKKMIIKLDKSVSNGIYNIVYYYNTNILKNTIENSRIDRHGDYILRYMLERKERLNIVLQCKEDIKNIIENVSNDVLLYNNTRCNDLVDDHVFNSDIKLYNYQKSDINWIKHIEMDVLYGRNKIEYVKKYDFKILNNKYMCSYDFRNICTNYHCENDTNDIFSCNPDIVKYSGGNIISEMGLGKTLIMMYVILSDKTIDRSLYDFIEFDVCKCNYFYKSGNKKGTSCGKSAMDGLYCKEHKNSLFIDKRKIIYKDYFNEYFDIRNYFDECMYLNTKATLIICPSHLCDQWCNEFYNKCNENIKKKSHVVLVTTYNQYINLTVGDILFADMVIISYNFLINTNYLKTTRKQKKIMMKNSIINENGFSFHIFKWHRIVFEEFHEIRDMNNNNAIQKACYELKSNYRWNISGTPFANGVLGFIDSLKLNTNIVMSSPYINNITDSNFENCLLRDVCYSGLNSNLMRQCSFLFKRNTKESIKNEYKGNNLNDNTMFLTFTKEERAIYDSHLTGYNNKYSKFLLQLCCHPELYSETKNLLKNCKTLGEIQKSLLLHHQRNLNYSKQKLSVLKKEHDSLQKENQSSPDIQQKLTIVKRKMTMEKKTHDNILNTLSYLNKAIDNIKTVDSCPICLDNIENIAITSCGHKFCWDCFEEYSKMTSIHKCPSCNTMLSKKDVYLLEDSIYNMNLSELDVIVNDTKSTKIGNIVYWVKEQIKNEPTSKMIIFSQWDDILNKVGENIQNYKINVLYCTGSVYQKKKSIQLFSQDNNDYNIILLSSKNAASGINLTKANKIIFVESIIGDYQYRSNIETQAIGRSARIGNNQNIDIIKFIINDTIESDIHNNLVDDAILSKLNI